MYETINSPRCPQIISAINKNLNDSTVITVDVYDKDDDKWYPYTIEITEHNHKVKRFYSFNTGESFINSAFDFFELEAAVVESIDVDVDYGFLQFHTKYNTHDALIRFRYRQKDDLIIKKSKRKQ